MNNNLLNDNSLEYIFTQDAILIEWVQETLISLIDGTLKGPEIIELIKRNRKNITTIRTMKKNMDASIQVAIDNNIMMIDAFGKDTYIMPEDSKRLRMFEALLERLTPYMKLSESVDHLLGI